MDGYSLQFKLMRVLLEFGKHKFDELSGSHSEELKSTSVLIKHIHLQAIKASNSQGVFPV